jgi:thiamine-phosphate pyrophosphorylase
MSSPFALPRIYPILDAASLALAGISLESFALEWRGAGIRFLQYRDKHSPDAAFVEQAHRLRQIFPSVDSTLILNDRAHLCIAARSDGIHIGQQDGAPSAARDWIGPTRCLGLSTHNEKQLVEASGSPVDYIAIGPVFGTASKTNPDPAVGLAGIRTARALTTKPLVAIGGINLENAQSVFDAGADSIALIAALLPTPGYTTGKVIEEFLARVE